MHIYMYLSQYLNLYLYLYFGEVFLVDSRVDVSSYRHLIAYHRDGRFRDITPHHTRAVAADIGNREAGFGRRWQFRERLSHTRAEIHCAAA